MYFLLTDERYKLNFDKNGNTVTRNTKCLSGGNLITIFVTNPRAEYVVGIELDIIPYIPQQNLGQNEYFPAMKITEKFENFKKQSGINITVSLKPELSYYVSGSFQTPFGRLMPSKNISISGEFESLMSDVGCTIKNNFFFENEDISNGGFVAKW